MYSDVQRLAPNNQKKKSLCSIHSFRIAEDPSVLSVIPTVSSSSNKPLPLEMPSSVGVVPTYSHQAVEQSQGSIAAARMEPTETKEAPLDGPPGTWNGESMSVV